MVVDGVRRVGIGTEPTTSDVGTGRVRSAAGSLASSGRRVVGSFTALGKVPHEVANIFKTKPATRTIGGDGASVTSVVGVARVAGEGFSAGGVLGRSRDC